MKNYLFRFFICIFILFMTSCGGSGSSSVSSESSQTILHDESEFVAIGTVFQDPVDSNIEFLFPEEFSLIEDDDSLSTFAFAENPSNNIIIGDWGHRIPNNPFFTETFSVEVCSVAGTLAHFSENGYDVWLLEFDYGDISRSVYFRSDRDSDWSYDAIVHILATCPALMPDESEFVAIGTVFQDPVDSNIEFLFPEEFSLIEDDDSLSTFRSAENPSNNILIGDWGHIIPNNPFFTETFSVEVCSVTGTLAQFSNNGYDVWLLEFDYGDISRSVYFRSDGDSYWSYDAIVHILATCPAPRPDESELDAMSTALDGTRFIDSDDPTVQFLFPSFLTSKDINDELRLNGVKSAFAFDSNDIYISISENRYPTSPEQYNSEPFYICGVYGVSFTNESDLGIFRIVEFSKNSRDYRVLALIEAHTGFSNQDLEQILNTCPR